MFQNNEGGIKGKHRGQAERLVVQRDSEGEGLAKYAALDAGKGWRISDEGEGRVLREGCTCSGGGKRRR